MYDVVVMENCLDPVVIRSQSVVELTHSNPMGLEHATHTIEALAEWYLNGSQRILGNYSLRPSTVHSLMVLSQIRCPHTGSFARPIQTYSHLT
jgi:hypothetical protein